MLVGNVGRMVMNSISDRFILFFPPFWCCFLRGTLLVKKKGQNQFVLQNLKLTGILILSVENTECKLGCTGVEDSACCTHQFCFICLSSSLCSFFFVENPLGNLCLHSAQYEEILSYCKGASTHDGRNGNKFHISRAEVLIAKITAPLSAAFNVCLQTLFQELDFSSLAISLWGGRGTEWRRRVCKLILSWNMSKDKPLTIRENNILMAEARCMLIIRGLFLNPWAFFPVGLFPFPLGRWGMWWLTGAE